MARLFEERERAAENIFVHEEELRFLALRRGMQSLAAWAAEGMALDATRAATYERGLIDAFVAGTPEDEISRKVQTDLERAGKPSLSIHVGTTLARSVAQATAALRGAPDSPPSKAPATLPDDPRKTFDQHHPKSPHPWGWGV